MPRKTKAQVLKEKVGGNWIFDRINSDRWICDDGRICIRTVDCRCWMFDDEFSEPCRCKVHYKIDGEDVDLSDPRCYRLNGKSTHPKRGR